MKLKNSYIGSTVGLIIGILLIGAMRIGLGIVVIFGALGYKSYKKRILEKTKKWPIPEIISGILLLVHVGLGITSGNWYYQPVEFIVIPIWIAISYLILFLSRESTK